jgi:hypothetical protein
MEKHVIDQEAMLTPVITRYLQLRLFTLGLDGTISEDEAIGDLRPKRLATLRMFGDKTRFIVYCMNE